MGKGYAWPTPWAWAALSPVAAVDGSEDHPKILIADEALKNHVRALKVVNDSAKHVVALIKQFAGTVKHEGQHQYLLHVVYHHRSEIPERTKSACYGSHVCDL